MQRYADSDIVILRPFRRILEWHLLSLQIEAEYERELGIAITYIAMMLIRVPR